MIKFPNATVCIGLFRVAEEDVFVNSSDRRSGTCASVSFNSFFFRALFQQICIFFSSFHRPGILVPQSSNPRHGEVSN